MSVKPAGARSFRPDRRLDLVETLRPLRRGRGDPCTRFGRGEVWRATWTPLGPASEHLRQRADGSVLVEAWGPGSEWLLERAPILCGALDDDSGFVPRHRLLRELRGRHPGLRICRTEAVFEACLASIVEQRVPGVEAWRSWRWLVLALGEPAPGPLPGLWVPPMPERVVRTPYHVFHTFGIERRRADTLRRAAACARRLEEVLTLSPEQVRTRLCALPGIGAWTAAEVALVALGDADAVPIGDYHLPHLVSWALAGEPRGSDQRMLELLEPYRGHRARVLRLLLTAGLGAPRFAPRLPLRDLARM